MTARRQEKTLNNSFYKMHLFSLKRLILLIFDKTVVFYTKNSIKNIETTVKELIKQLKS